MALSGSQRNLVKMRRRCGQEEEKEEGKGARCIRRLKEGHGRQSVTMAAAADQNSHIQWIDRSTDRGER